ncbi:isochorismate synthase [Propionibacteriaceae bacterium G57]|uniref:isochorismate synthase n=1 Tax=Aestuariimicrobium sp. G57 TaxID=3418485 RepID=UPI003DA6E95C
MSAPRDHQQAGAPTGRLHARTVVIPDPGPLQEYLPPTGATAFLRRGDGIVGIGELRRFEAPTMAEADELWRDFIAGVSHVSDLPGHFGTGPLAFGTFTFDPDATSARSVLIVPRVVLGRRKDVSWATWLTIGGDDPLAGLPIDDDPYPMPQPQPSPAPHGNVEWREGTLAGDAYAELVARGVAAIRAGGVDKVVLARDVVARADRPIDPRTLVSHLSAEYPTTWTYLVDGMVGATPEMLVRREGGLATSRVLAGTIRRAGVSDEDARTLADALSSSSKDLREHEFAVRSVAQAMAPFCSGMNVPDAPYVLELPNVLHLATDITGVARAGTTSLALAAALHPSAAVCGTPTDVARRLIAELEGIDRGRYAGPVGWVDAEGNGEWAIALRGGQLSADDPRRITLHAGCGIVADSDPAAELAETRAKLLPMREAIGY